MVFTAHYERHHKHTGECTTRLTDCCLTFLWVAIGGKRERCKLTLCKPAPLPEESQRCQNTTAPPFQPPKAAAAAAACRCRLPQQHWPCCLLEPARNMLHNMLCQFSEV